MIINSFQPITFAARFGGNPGIVPPWLANPGTRIPGAGNGTSFVPSTGMPAAPVIAQASDLDLSVLGLNAASRGTGTSHIPMPVA